MPESAGQFSYGSKVEISTDDVSYAEIAEVAMATFPDRTRKTAKATHLQSPDQHTEEKPAMKETSKPTLTFNLNPAQYNTLDGYFEAGTILYWRFSVPARQGESTPERHKFLGFITKLGGPKADPDDANVMQSEIEITRSSNKVTWSAGA